MDPNAPNIVPAASGDLEDEAALRSRLLRKRTKTGCLTCRRRRIKCGEERPVCRNCIKSKRLCEGYNQRVAYRPQTIDFQHLSNGAASITFPANNIGVPMALPSPGMPVGAYSGPELQPRLQPLTIPGPDGQHIPYGMPYSAPAYQQAWAMGSMYPDSAATTAPVHYHPGFQHYAHDFHSPSAQSAISQYFPPDAHFAHDHPQQPHHVPQAALHGVHMPPNQPTTPGSVHSHHWHQQQSPANPSPQSTTATHVNALPASTWSRPPAINMPLTPAGAPSHSWPSDLTLAPATSSIDHQYVSAQATYDAAAPHYSATAQEGSPEAHPYFAQQQPAEDVLSAAAVEYHDVDYYDVDVSAEPDAFVPASDDPSSREELALAHILKLGDLQLGKTAHHAIGYSEGILDTYRPEQVATPLKNPATARVFTHFIRVTAPTISSSDRGPLMPLQMERHTIPFSKRSFWSHTMPLAALSDQGLLQAILALSSLHIAKLTSASSTPSYKHYAYALKSVHQSVGKSKNRNTIPVMGASLLLAIYELWCAEHVKWSSHLAGEAQLLVEADFVASQRQIQRLRLQKAADEQQGFASFRRRTHTGQIPVEEKVKMKQYADLGQLPQINSHVVSIMAGRVVDYDDHGQILDGSSFESKPIDLDIPTYEVQKDLFWAYARQDMIGSLVGANPLLMPYSRWTDCPPRSGINDVDAPCGSHDHLILLLGRMAEFAVTDRKRKLRVIESHGGKWRPASWMNVDIQPQPPTPPVGQRTHGTKAKVPSPTMPGYFGMAPIPFSAAMPSSYQTEGAGHGFAAASPEHEDLSDLPDLTQRAIAEWNEIVQALDTFQSMLGPAFQPLPVDANAVQTPFGLPLVHRSSTIGSLWGYLMVARIFIHRLHPDMPPHAHVAAAIAAKQTMPFAMHIGRIAAGVLPARATRTIHPTVAAAMCDLCLPLFFAGVQVVDAAQREWIVSALFDIERQCAYETAGVIAHGCQTAWHNSGKADRGPRYELRFNTCAQDERLNGKWTQIDPRKEPDQSDDTNRMFVHSRPAARLHWAVGILGTEGDG